MTPAEVVASVAHGNAARARDEPTGDALADRRAITSGANSATAASTPARIERASGTRKSSHRNLSAAAPRTAFARSPRRAASSASDTCSGSAKIRAPAGSSGRTVPGCATHATS